GYNKCTFSFSEADGLLTRGFEPRALIAALPLGGAVILRVWASDLEKARAKLKDILGIGGSGNSDSG
ncbi:MAG: hypothetical protein QF662_07495, partial [Phycisphaerae bacterium]|nr:hypothetical protein [Phycisphaerae bacterium]